MIHGSPVLIIFFWLGLAVLVNTVVPQLEKVGRTHMVSMVPAAAPSIQAMSRIGQVFGEFDTDTAVMIVIEGDHPLGDDAHRYYAELVRRLSQDKHVEHVQDLWGDPLTAAGSQSLDGKAAYVQAHLVGNQGENLANQSVAAVRRIVATTAPPPGVRAYVAGGAAVTADGVDVGDRGIAKITAITGAVILVMLLFIYRSVATMILIVATVGIELAVSRGIVAILASHNAFGLSTYAVNLLVVMAMAAGTDYAIFVVGRYQEARHAGEHRTDAFYTMFRGTAHVVLGSGLTVAGAMYCLSLTRLPYFQTLGPPCAIGMLVTVFGALTLGPAILVAGSSFGLFEPKRLMRTRGWRRLGTAIVRWPGPILAVTIAVSLIGLLALPGYNTNYDNRRYMPADMPANVGYQAADRHFSLSRMNPELLLVETDHDMRNPSGMLVLNRVARAVYHVPGVARVQAITRPLGTPLEHTSIPFLISVQGAVRMENLKYLKDRAADMLTQADTMQQSIDTLERMYQIMQKMSATTDRTDSDMHDMLAIIDRLRDHFADFDDFLRPIRSYFYWERHCFDVPICWSLRSMFESFDGVDQEAEKLRQITADMDITASLVRQMLTQIPRQIAVMKNMKNMMLSMHSSMSSFYDQTEVMGENSTAMGQAFDAAKNDDSFYLPPEAFENPDFKRILKLFVSPDGKAARFIISHEGNPATPDGISRVGAIRGAAKEAIKGTPLEGAKIYVGGPAALYKDMRDGSKYDLLIAGIAATSLIFIIMLIITRSAVAALVIVGTVLLSLATSFGLSVLVWQHIFRIELHWMVLAMSIILLLAVGSDYNLLLVSRFREEIGAGLKTGIIRAMAGTGGVVTSAGLVFAATMSSFVFSDLRILGQVGTTIGIGLLFDTLVVRSFLTPSIAVLLGRWFWWPQRVRLRPASELFDRAGSRTLVRSLLLPTNGQAPSTNGQSSVTDGQPPLSRPGPRSSPSG